MEKNEYYLEIKNLMIEGLKEIGILEKAKEVSITFTKDFSDDGIMYEVSSIEPIDEDDFFDDEVYKLHNLSDLKLSDLAYQLLDSAPALKEALNKMGEIDLIVELDI